MRNVKSRLRLTGWDKIVISSISFFSVASLFTLSSHMGMAERAIVSQNGARIAEISLKEDGVKDLPVTTGKMKYEVRQGRVRILESDCPRKMCMHQNWIGGTGQVIVCLPNKVIMEIEGGTNTRYDILSH
ncbi:hypothetical protein COY52_08645 [Candidatus Desantisbacteria bacterium CG_4_10_14_0_8_um_filter_48_22]|uniref:Uncharacterized protein n=1 Tax=Candidatus Desantisbacteria bacterium CG_4_10_14_0_8_um_filter_48_22 TaxID=1974543 RepID=A0A2M7S8L6_9BACT|nr:MAG: hypothetical protein COS16_06745 [Candidatus Desantisbacteria bacterium CG02_land_8_20_14_3_00_49_13]PIZ15885.1 MAG: hypothetical protein COY52_08645 [Candidatus Desantisbacteria bacterium CG_4_10_14_0_8_um_filter_48_22]